MKRAAFVLRVKAGQEARYLEAHRPGVIWPSILDACSRAGVRNYSGWLGGNEDGRVFAYFEAVEPLSSLEQLARDPANAAWQAHMAPLMDSGRLAGDGAGLQMLHPAFYLP